MNKDKIKKFLRMNRSVEENELIDFLQESDKFIFDDYISSDLTLYEKEKNKLLKLNTLLFELNEDDLIEPYNIYNWFDVEDCSLKISSIRNKEKEDIQYLLNLLNIMYLVKNSIGLSIMSNVKMSVLTNSYSSDNTNNDIAAMDEEYLAKLNQINVNAHDNENRHESADILLVQVLEELGLTKTAERFSRLAEGFWYA